MKTTRIMNGIRNFAVAAFIAFLTTQIMAAPRSAPSQQDFYTTVDPNVSNEALKKADGLRVKTISSIIAILDSKKTKKNRKFELYLRLGELYAERHDYIRDQEFKEYDRRYSKWVSNAKKGKEPKLSTRKSKKELTKSVNAFRDLVRTFPNHKRTDAALFALGKTLSRLGNDNAVMYFEKLVKSHKKSKLIPDTYVAMAEYYFEKNKISKAIDAYKKVLKFKKHKSYPYAVYKLGWSYYNNSSSKGANEKKMIGKAVTALKLVIKLSDKNKKRHGVLDLKEESLKDLVMVWAETENTKDAWSYFKSIGQKKHFYSMLATLGNTYYDNGKHKNAIKIFSRLLKEDPTREDNPAIHSKLVDLHAKTGNIKSVVAECKNMNRLYVTGSPWTIKNAKNKSVIEEGKIAAELYTHRYSTLYHKKGQKTNQKVYLNAAEDLYESHLKTFKNHKNSYDVEFYLADIKYDFKKYDSAADHFTSVAKRDTKKGKYLKNSAYNAVLSINKLDQRQKYSKLPKPGKVEKPISLPRVKKRFVEVIDNYVSWLPKEKDGNPMRFTAAQTYYDYGHYDEAIKRFSAIAETLPKTAQGKSSVKVILGHFSSRKDWANTIAWSRKLGASKSIAKAGHSKTITAILKGALFSRALDLEKKKNYAEAAKGFIGFQSEFPKDKNADLALYNATVNYYKIGEVESALSAGKKVLDGYPKSKIADEVLINSAQTYESLAQFDQAAKYYDLFARKYPNDKKASAALFNAAVLNKGLHKFAASTAGYERFVKRYPKDPMVADALLEIAGQKEKKKDFKGAIAAYKSYGKKVTKDVDARLYAEAKAAELTRKHVSSKSGRKMLAKLQRTLTAKNSPNAFEARRLVAKAYFSDLDAEFLRFKKNKIKDANKIEKELQNKQKSLVSLAASYQKVIALANGEYTVASLFRLGEMHEQFAHQLVHVPSPSSASQIEIDKLRTELEKVAFPLRDQAYKFFETAHRRSSEVVTLSDWTRRSYNKMSELNSEKFPEVLEQVSDAQYMSHKLEIDKSVAELTE